MSADSMSRGEIGQRFEDTVLTTLMLVAGLIALVLVTHVPWFLSEILVGEPTGDVANVLAQAVGMSLGIAACGALGAAISGIVAGARLIRTLLAGATEPRTAQWLSHAEFVEWHGPTTYPERETSR